MSKSLVFDRSNFYNKTLDQYPNLYREFSSENFNYYGITDETSYPLCKLKYDDEESIEDLVQLIQKYKKETGHKPWQLSKVHESEVINSPENKVSDLSFPSSGEQYQEKGPITFEARSDLELIINSPCPICDGKHGNYGLYGSWYCENGNQFSYDPELAKLYSQDKLEYCLACNTSSNKLKFAIVV
ncbi:hypothetical protein GLOIN_2v1764899 [Rhizophagus irregularis DAOM 181602=DAOM 197198]|nr:hypothetical protein GLOIN_2v1764899 [Rhizophagus irregularis DAOM 181602=DAOM 197198]